MRECDLVLGGGGVRGIAHVGALAAMADAGWQPYRVAGASAGALAGALSVAGASAAEMRGYLEELDYRGFAFADVLARFTSRRVVGAMVERLGPDVVDPLVWIASMLSDHGVRTWADLRLDDDASSHLPESRRYALVVRCLDVVNRRVVRLPWDYHRYDLDPDEQSVAEAVRASMSVPMVFSPVEIGTGPGRGLLVDGGLGAGFPAATFDRTDGAPPQRPTFAVRLVPRSQPEGWPDGDLAVVRAVIDTMLNSADNLEPLTVCDERRTIRIDASRVVAMDVRLKAADQQALFEAGETAVQQFLATYDHAQWLTDCR